MLFLFALSQLELTHSANTHSLLQGVIGATLVSDDFKKIITSRRAKIRLLYKTSSFYP